MVRGGQCRCGRREGFVCENGVQWRDRRAHARAFTEMAGFSVEKAAAAYAGQEVVQSHPLCSSQSNKKEEHTIWPWLCAGARAWIDWGGATTTPGGPQGGPAPAHNQGQRTQRTQQTYSRSPPSLFSLCALVLLLTNPLLPKNLFPVQSLLSPNPCVARLLLLPAFALFLPSPLAA